MRELLFGVVLLVATLGPIAAKAATLTVDPALSSVVEGDLFDVEIEISGLGNLAPDSLGVWDIDVLYDPAVIQFNAVAFGDSSLGGTQLDVLGFGSFTDFSDTPGALNLFELSFDLPLDLDNLQPGSFTLATLTFEGVGVGSSPLDISVNALGDSFGDPLLAEVVGGSVSVAPIPEPNAAILFGIGSLIVAGALRRESERRARLN